MNMRVYVAYSVAFLLLAILGVRTVHATELGLFEGQTEVGNSSRPGTAVLEPADNSFLIAGGGENMWFTNDAFHFVWKRIPGDFELNAAITWLGSGGNPHRKACLIVRQNLRADSPYIDVAVHGNGLTSLQFR